MLYTNRQFQWKEKPMVVLLKSIIIQPSAVQRILVNANHRWADETFPDEVLDEPADDEVVNIEIRRVSGKQLATRSSDIHSNEWVFHITRVEIMHVICQVLKHY